MPEDIGYAGGSAGGDDVIEELIRLATDPAADIATPADTGVTNQGLAAPQPGLVPAPTLDFRSAPSFEQGGVVQAPPAPGPGPGPGPGPAPGSAGPGVGINPAGLQQQAISPQMMESEIQRLVKERPEEILKMKEAVMQAIQAGELTPQELNTIGQLAKAAVQDPALYPQIRQFALDQNLAAPQDIPPQYDQGTAFALMMVARSVSSEVGGPGMPQATGQPPQSVGQPVQGSFRQGGEVPASRNADGSVPINAHDGEVVIHAGVVKAKGTEFFEKFNDGYELDGKAKQKA
jgi:hypothetical protein